MSWAYIVKSSAVQTKICVQFVCLDMFSSVSVLVVRHLFTVAPTRITFSKVWSGTTQTVGDTGTESCQNFVCIDRYMC